MPLTSLHIYKKKKKNYSRYDVENTSPKIERDSRSLRANAFENKNYGCTLKCSVSSAGNNGNSKTKRDSPYRSRYI